MGKLYSRTRLSLDGIHVPAFDVQELARFSNGVVRSTCRPAS